MKSLLLIIAFISVNSFSCEKEFEVTESPFLKDMLVSIATSSSDICIDILVDSYDPASNHYVSSVDLYVKNDEGKSVFWVKPQKEKVAYGQNVYTACFSENYLQKSILAINSTYKQEAWLEKGKKISQLSSLCQKTEHIEFGKALSKYEKKREKKP